MASIVAPRLDELPLGDVAQRPKDPRSTRALSEMAAFDGSSAKTAPASAPVAAAASVTMRPLRRFAGFTYAQLGIGALILGAAVWGMWATAKILALEDRRVVSVRLAQIVNDFVAAEARSGTPPEQLEARTRTFMMALDAVLKKRADGGQVVLVGEAVIASSVPDVTKDVVADLGKLVKLPAPAAIPPLMPAPAIPSGAPAAASPGRAPSPLPGYDGAAPFGAPAAPAYSEQMP